jgi:hypothetical protein
MKRRKLGLSTYYLDICLEGLSNTAKNASQDDRCPGRDSKLEALEYKSRAVLLHRPHCVIFQLISIIKVLDKNLKL